MLLIQIGLIGGWSSPALARLTADDSPIPLTPEQASWVAAVVNLGRVIGAILGALGTHHFGSKKTIFFTLIPIAIGWLIITFANAVEWLYVSRLCSGIGIGMGFGTFPLFIGEVSMPEIRGALISLATVGTPFGQLIASLGGAYLSLNIASSVYLVLVLLLMGLFFWLPESPHHLVRIGDLEAAKKSIDWYRAGRGVDAELDSVEKFAATDGAQTFAQKLREFKTPKVIKSTVHVTILYTYMQICGLNSVLFYMETILRRANFELFHPSLCVVYVNLCGILAAAFSIFLIDRCGRRFLLLISSSGVTLAMIGLMSYFLLINSSVDLKNLQFLPMCSMFLYATSFLLGLQPVPSAVLSETFPSNIKCIASCIIGIIAAIMSFVSSKTYQPLVDLLGESYVFMIYAICAITVIPYTLFAMKETKGQSLQQIQDAMSKK